MRAVLVCVFFVRSLPPLAKKYVVQILFFDGPVSGKLLEQWVLADGVTKHRVAIDRLIQLRIFIEVSDK
jgi:transcription initiation factor TFIIH subunit 4